MILALMAYALIVAMRIFLWPILFEIVLWHIHGIEPFHWSVHALAGVYILLYMWSQAQTVVEKTQAALNEQINKQP